MTVIAWDGKTLAADKRGVCMGLHRTVTKIFRPHKFVLVGVAGADDGGFAMLEWVKAGMVPDAFPKSQQSEHTKAIMLLVRLECEQINDPFERLNRHDAIPLIWRAKQIEIYDSLPQPNIIEDRQHAIGSGRDYAMAAMFLGKTAAEAVEVACHFDTSCGNGVDVLEASAWK